MIRPRTNVLFMQTQDYFGADSQIHASIMTHLDRERFTVHCAVPRARGGSLAASAKRIRQIPDVSIRPTEFGPSLDRSSKREVLAEGLRWGVPATMGILALVRYARRNDVRIVHCTEKPRDVLYGMFVARLSRAHCVVHVHVKAETWIRAAVRRAMHSASALIGVSEFVAGSIRDLGYDPAKVSGVLNGLELDEWIGDDVGDGADIRREFSIGPTAPLLVSASRLYRYKGQHELLAALPIVRERVPDVSVLIVGEDDPRSYSGEASYMAELRRICDQLDLHDIVTFTGFRSDVRSIMSASDLFVMPSFEEPFGMVFIESMSLRRPVVALDNGGTKEVVDHGGSGLLSDRDDTAALADNIVTLLLDDETRARMGEHGRRRVIELLNAERMTREVEQVYDTVTTSVR